MESHIALIEQQFNTDLAQAQTTKDIEALKVRYLGKKGIIQEPLIKLKEVSPQEKPRLGKLVNTLKQSLEQSLDSIYKSFLKKEENDQLQSEILDISLPARTPRIGTKHPVIQLLDRIVEIFISMGFSVQTGPEIESEYYNFTVLNFPEDHPARDMQDTFYIDPKTLLRTHTSNIQGRVLESTKPPVRIVCPGRVYRNETISARSHVFFHQVEGIYVDEHVNLQGLLKTLTQFLHNLFQKEVDVRFRTSYFPFVEPGVEVDVACLLCSGKGCTLCKKTGWLEILGAGMVHPNVLRAVGIDPEKYSGYAWGMGVERLCMRMHGITDIRNFYENDMRFLRQFIQYK